MFEKLKAWVSKSKKIFILLFLFSCFIFSHATGQEKRSTILTAERIDGIITIDGFANESSWVGARELVTLAKDGSIGKVDVSIKTLYNEDNIYFFVSWEDPTESVIKNTWSFNGTAWEKSEDEDRLSFIWNIDGSIDGFDIAGCAMLCHGDRMHTNAPGERGDMWHWKSSRSNPVGIVDDQWMNDRIVENYTEEAYEAAHVIDAGEPFYTANLNEEGVAPKYFEPSPVNEDDAKFLFQSEIDGGEAREIKLSDFRDGMNVPGYVLQKPSGSRGDIIAKGVWVDGRWNVEFMRSLKNGHEDDVQFDTTLTYRFGIAIMDNTGGFEAFGKGHSFDLGARTMEFGGRGSKEVVELALVRDYLTSAKAYVNRDESGLALSTISDALVVFNRIRDPFADIDPELFIKVRNSFVDSRRDPSLENINQLIENVDLAILTFQGKRTPPEATLGLKILVLWGKFGIYAFIALAIIVFYPIYRMLKIVKRPEFRYLSIFMLMAISPIFLEGVGRLGALLKIPFLQSFSFTTSEYVTLVWVVGMFIALYVGRKGFNEIDNTLKSLEYYSKELEKKMDELKKSQNQLLRSERLASIGQLAASMAHEIRNPLGVIKNVSYYLNMTMGKSDEKVKKHLKILDQELVTSNKIITDLLDFSSGKEPTLKKSDLNTLIKKAVSRANKPKNISLELKLGVKLPRLMADEDQLIRVFLNIIMNSIQAMPDGGSLKILSKKEGDNFVIKFTDSGVGISDKELPMVFEPLFTTKAKGIGLGLALSKQLVKMHGGSIDAESGVGEGTTFIVRLPIRDKG
jgi:signal transduction histidine kinase